MDIKLFDKNLFMNKIRFYWWLLPSLALSAILMVSEIFVSLSGPRPDTAGGSILFLLGGWEMFHGRLPYVYMFDVKPPAIFETAAIFAVLTNGNRFLMHFLAVTSSVVLVGGVLVLAGLIVYEITENKLAGFLASITPIIHPVIYQWPGGGFTPKYFLAFFALLTVYLVLHDKPFLTGISSALGAAYFQPGFIMVVFVLLGYRKNPPKLKSSIKGVVLAAVVVLAPFVLGGATLHMISQSVLAPLVLDSNAPLLNTLSKLWTTLGLSTPILILSAVGGVVALKKGANEEGYLWVPALLFFFLFQIVFIDFDGVTDLIVLICVSGLGVGVLIDNVPRKAQYLIGLFVVVTVIVQIPLISGNDALEFSKYYGKADIYWTGQTYENCYGPHISNIEEVWIERYDQNPGRKCRATIDMILEIIKDV